MTDNAIEIKNLRKIYDNKFEALKGISLDIPKGSFYGLLGPNGAGKTTTIGAISGLVNYHNGSIKIMGYDNKKDYRTTRKLIGLSPQELNFDVFFPIKKVLEFQAGYYGLSYNKSKERTELMLEQFGLKDKQNNSCRELSGGMKRRLQIAKALIHDPEILILDEPTDGLDPNQKNDVRQLIRKLGKQKAIIISTHILEEVTAICNRAMIISNGKLLLDEKPKDLLKKSETYNSIFLSIEEKKLIDLKKDIIKNKITSEVDIIDSFCVVRGKNPKLIKNKIDDYIKKNKFTINHYSVGNGNLEEVFRRLTANE